MSDNNKEENKPDPETPKILTPKELLEKRKQYLAQTKGNRGFGHNAGSGAKGTAQNATGHKPRIHRPQGG